MAWRPNRELVAGELDNTVPGRVTGWLKFVGLVHQVQLQLRGDFHRDIRGAVLRLKNPHPTRDVVAARKYLAEFARLQRGSVGDITAGLPPQDYVAYPYVEWYSDENGRVVLECQRQDVEIIGTPLPWTTAEPIDRDRQDAQLVGFVHKLMRTVDQSAAAQQRTEKA